MLDRRRKLNDEQRQSIADDYAAGAKLSDIAMKFGIARGFVRNIARKLGCAPRHPEKSQIKRAYWADRHARNKSSSDNATRTQAV